MDIWQGINSVRAVREFSDKPISQASLNRILNAGRRAASSKNLQRWMFIVIRDRNGLIELARVGPFAGHVSQAALAIALVTPDPRAEGQPLSVMFDLGRAAQNMVLAAWAIGIGSVPATVYEQDLVRRILDLPPEMHCEYLLSIGYPLQPETLTAPNQPGGRFSLKEVVRYERWS